MPTAQHTAHFTYCISFADIEIEIDTDIDKQSVSLSGTKQTDIQKLPHGTVLMVVVL